MAEIIIMPKLGFNMSEGKLVTWYKKEGDEVRKNEPLFAIETDKTAIDIEATGDGILRAILVQENETVPVTLPVAIIAAAGENIDKEYRAALAQLGRTESISANAAVTSITEAPKAASASSTNAPAAGADPFDFDIIVVGGGPGGYVAAIKAAQLGKKTAIVEKENFGGVCLNKGCIPTKALLKSVEVLNDVRKCSEFGIISDGAPNAQIDLKAVQKRKSDIISQLVGGVGGLLAKNGVTKISGEASLTDKNTVKVGSNLYTANYIILATGSSSKTLPIPMDNSIEIMTSTEMLNLDEIPESAAVIGGGVIGIEFAYFLANLGVKVTVIEFLDRILPMVDEEITAQVVDLLSGLGVEIYTEAKVTEVRNGSVFFEKKDSIHAIPVKKALMSVGRAPELGGIDCEKLGIKTERGAVITDLSLRTSVDNIYAIGDINGKAMLAHTASAEGIVAVENICGLASVMNYDRIPTAIYIQPEIASVGLTEAQAKAKYKDIKIGKFPLAANGKAKIAGESRGFIKVITEAAYGEIVGVHIFSIHATDMISESVVAMTLEATAEELSKAIHPHPTVSEIYQEAFHAVSGKAIHC